MKKKLNFYEIVTIHSKENEHKEIDQKQGVVMGMAQDGAGDWVYAVEIDDDGWSIEEKYLVSTGKLSNRENFYNERDKIKIIVNENGEGKIKDE